MSHKHSRDISVDFDGVIHSYTSGWKGVDVVADPPVEDAIPFLVEATKHFNVSIFSTRNAQKGGIYAMQEWLKQAIPQVLQFTNVPHFDVEIFVMETLNWPMIKPPAIVVIDDRAVCFRGTFPSIEVLKNFKPWNKKGE